MPLDNAPSRILEDRVRKENGGELILEEYYIQHLIGTIYFSIGQECIRNNFDTKKEETYIGSISYKKNKIKKELNDIIIVVTFSSNIQSNRRTLDSIHIYEKYHLFK